MKEFLLRLEGMSAEQVAREAGRLRRGGDPALGRWPGDLRLRLALCLLALEGAWGPWVRFYALEGLGLDAASLEEMLAAARKVRSHPALGYALAVGRLSWRALVDLAWS
jgi:hypothetical protein